MKKILKHTLFAIFVILLAFPQGVFANQKTENIQTAAVKDFLVFSVSSTKQPSQSIARVLENSAGSGLFTAAGSISCNALYTLKNNYLNLQQSGSINFNKPANCFSITAGRQIKPAEHLSVKAAPQIQTQVIVLRKTYLSTMSNSPLFPVTGSAISVVSFFVFLESALGLLVVLAVLGKNLGLAGFYNKEINIHQLGVMRC